MDHIVLGIASRADGGRLSAHFVEVSLQEGEIAVAELEPWQGTRGQDAASQLADLKDAVANRLDHKVPSTPDFAALKRVEPPPVGRPKSTYDDRIRLEAAVMFAATEQGKRYFSYRTNQIPKSDPLVKECLEHATCPSSQEGQEAVKAACAALCNLRNEPN